MFSWIAPPEAPESTAALDASVWALRPPAFAAAARALSPGAALPASGVEGPRRLEERTSQATTPTTIRRRTIRPTLISVRRSRACASGSGSRRMGRQSRRARAREGPGVHFALGDEQVFERDLLEDLV